MQPSHSILDNLVTGVGLSTFGVANIAMHKRYTVRYKILVAVTSILCFIRAGVSFTEAISLYHSGKPIIVPMLYVLGALVTLFLTAQVLASSRAVTTTLKARLEEQVRDEQHATINTANLVKSELMVIQQKEGH